MKLLGLAQK